MWSRSDQSKLPAASPSPCFRVDSRVILDQPGAERLLGRGDMLFQAPDAAAPVRLQGTFVSDNEIQRLVQYWQAFAGMAAPASPTRVASWIACR